MENYEKILEDFGLSAKEVAIYITLLKLQNSNISNLSRKSGMPRTTLYPLLNKLLKRGLVNIIHMGNHDEWEAMDPKELYQKTKSSLKNLEEAIPALELLRGSLVGHKKSSDILFYKSKEGIKKAYESVFKLHPYERVYSIEGNCSIEAKKDYFSSKYTINWQSKIKDKKIVWEGLLGEKSLEIVKKIDNIEILKNSLGRMVIGTLLPDNLMDFDSDIISFKDVLIITIVSQNTTIFINNKEAAKAFQNLFLIAQQAGKKVDLNSYIKELIEAKSK